MKNLSVKKLKKQSRTLVNYGRNSAVNGYASTIGNDPTNTTFTIVTTASHPVTGRA